MLNSSKVFPTRRTTNTGPSNKEDTIKSGNIKSATTSKYLELRALQTVLCVQVVKLLVHT